MPIRFPIVDEYLNKPDAKLSNLQSYVGSKLIEEWVLRLTKLGNYHRNGSVHIHGLSYPYTPYELVVSLDEYQPTDEWANEVWILSKPYGFCLSKESSIHLYNANDLNSSIGYIFKDELDRNLPVRAYWNLPQYSVMDRITINLARIGMVSINPDDVFDNLSFKLELCQDYALHKKEMIGKAIDKKLLHSVQDVNTLMMSINLTGMNILCQYLFQEGILSNIKYIQKVLKHIVRECKKYESEGIKWVLESIPDAKVDARLNELSIRLYGKYFTSTPYSMEEKIAIAKSLYPIYTGRVIHYIDKERFNLDVLRELPGIIHIVSKGD